ncbi:CAF17-like 4Fe-4S cluster assembly/insertion protein YgfZ [Algibacillus agarilyticus]|uniref:CAF17-like 4Fe-4S cluster assembly/insertion protein YgfZ n=1 Tax=Algibacillus agarilyticus TaxID=2234133 RepID=UPI000DCF9D76|nr:folate-binding Fe/S cluster repair protein [Algibacillus agarilyticus]
MSTQNLSLIKLENWGAIQLSGTDSKTYLNSQVTAHISGLADNTATFGAHCDAKGKSWSHFYFVPTGSTFQLFQRKNTLAKSLAELSKYAVFSKTDITDSSDNLTWYALLGEQSAEQHRVIGIENTYQVSVSNTLTLIACEGDLPKELANLNQADEALFEKALVEQGIVFMHDVHQSEYVPQMLNLQAINGISFTKGCYMGQETVARMRYLGKNKRAAFPFSGQANELKINDTLEIQNGENWRRAGTIVTLVKVEQTYYGIAVCAADIDIAQTLRAKQDEQSTFTLSPLPYSLEYKATK